MTRVILVAGVVASSLAHADPASLTIDEAIRYADAHHPARRADTAAERAAEFDLDGERARYVPDLELFAQVERSSANATPGAVFAVPGLPTLGGVPGRVIDSGDWGSAIGATVSWDALGYRTWNAAIARAQAEARLAHDEGNVDRLDIEYTAADRFLAALGHAETVTAAKAGVERAQVFSTIVKAAVGSQLRAGADLSRAEAELAFAQNAFTRAEAASDVGLAELAEALGAPSYRPSLIAGNLVATPPRSHPAAIARDPRVAVADDRAGVAEAQLDLVETGTRPKLWLMGALWGRGNGELSGPADFAHGLVPDVPNWALGVVLTWPVLAGNIVDPAARAGQARVDRERAHEQQVVQQLQSRGDRASVLVAGAYRVAETTPIALRAARDAEQQITARYKAQLATADEVAQVQRLLVQAEVEDALARLDVWRALLFRAYAAGDLAPFVSLYREGGR